jgi:uncharacterized protein (TIGR03086 family)
VTRFVTVVRIGRQDRLMSTAAGRFHVAVCRRFGDAVRSAAGKWDRRSPCEAWSVRDVLEHVIGFHDVLLLRPFGVKPDRPRDDPQRRWELTFERVRQALERDQLRGAAVEVPAVGTGVPRELDAATLIPRLTRDVLVHTWDVARAVGADDRLDPRWCEIFLAQLPPERDALTEAGLFAPPVRIDDHADAASKLLAHLGRDPYWQPPAGT